MTLEELQGINDANAGTIVAKIRKKERKIKYGDKTLTISDVLKQFDPNQHEVYDRSKRKDKIIEIPAPNSTDDDPKTVPDTVYVNRSSNPAQRLIVNRANAFLTGNPVEMIAAPETDQEKELQKIMQRIWDNNKMDYRCNDIGKKMMSETHVAVIVYLEPLEADADDYTGLDFNSTQSVRVQIVSKSQGDDLYPIFDKRGKMIAFARGYVDIDDDDKKTKMFEIYTAQSITSIVESDLGTYKVEKKLNLVGKITVAYFSQPQPEWLDVQGNIERGENLVSNFGDTNDYYSSPTTVVKGDLIGMSKKGERGKILEVDENADVSLLEWSNATEAVALEDKIQERIIMTGTQTPDISFEGMKGIGTAPSGVALRLMFFDASLKVKDKAPTYGESLQRLFNIFKACIRKLDTRYEKATAMQFKPKIEPYFPQNTEEKVALLGTASEKAVMSQETAIRMNPMIQDPDKEIELMAAETKADAEREFGNQLE